MGEVPRRRGLLWKMEQALRPFLPIVSLLASAGWQMKKAIYVKKEKKELSPLRAVIIFAIPRSNWNKELFFWMLLAKPSMRSWVSLPSGENSFWSLSFLADEVLATKAGEHLDIKQREGIHHLFSQGVKFKMWMTSFFIFHTNHKQIYYCHREWSTRWSTFVSSNHITKNSLLSQGVKHKMRMNILRQVSKTSELQVGRLSSREGEDLLE